MTGIQDPSLLQQAKTRLSKVAHRLEALDSMRQLLIDEATGLEILIKVYAQQEKLDLIEDEFENPPEPVATIITKATHKTSGRSPGELKQAIVLSLSQRKQATSTQIIEDVTTLIPEARRQVIHNAIYNMYHKQGKLKKENNFYHLI